MADPDDDLDALGAPATDPNDPVTRMPKRMYVPAPEEESGSAGPQGVLVIAAAGGLVGALLGAMGLAIVWATFPTKAPVVVVVAAPSAPARPRLLRPPPVFELDSDASAPREPPPPGPIYEVNQQPLGRRTLADALRSLAVPPDDTRAVTGVFQALFNMRTLQPDDRVAVMRDPITRELRRVEYRRATTQVWAAALEGDTWRGERVQVVVTSARVAAGFRVEGSVQASLQSAGLHAELAARLSSVFAAIALPPRMMGGDTVRLVVEEERINGQFYRYTHVHGVDYRGAWGRRRAFWVAMGSARGDFFNADGRTFEQGPLHSPMPDAPLTAQYNPDRVDPVLHVRKPHNGVDFEAPEGASVFASADGVVTAAGMAGPSGNLVVLQHRELRISTGYAHLARVAPGVRAGVPVRAGQLIGYVGSTGRSLGPHLHFWTKRNGLFFDPMSMLGVRRAIREQARPLFDARSRLIAGELDRVAVDGVALAEPDAGVPDAGPLPTLAPLEVGATGIRSEGDEEQPFRAQDPLDETEEVQ